MPEIDEQYEAAAERDRERQEEAERANSLRLEQAAARDRERQEEAEMRNDPVAKLKQGVRQKRIAEQKKQSVFLQKANVAGKGTGKIYLRFWQYLIPSFGLTLIGIDIYCFMRGVMGAKLFPRLGDAIAGELGSAGATGGSKARDAANLGETIGVPLLNFIALMIILFSLSFIGIMANIYMEPWRFFSAFLSDIIRIFIKGT